MTKYRKRQRKCQIHVVFDNIMNKFDKFLIKLNLGIEICVRICIDYVGLIILDWLYGTPTSNWKIDSNLIQVQFKKIFFKVQFIA